MRLEERKWTLGIEYKSLLVRTMANLMTTKTLVSLPAGN